MNERLSRQDWLGLVTVVSVISSVVLVMAGHGSEAAVTTLLAIAAGSQGRFGPPPPAPAGLATT